MGAGLSPRVRGNQAPFCVRHPPDRSIPACAGEPDTGGRVAVFRGVYPRVCGGTGVMLLTGLGPSGLSPRVRGNPHVQVDNDLHERSIPACAGEPPGISHAAVSSQVYPRVCGGTGSLETGTGLHKGLSPRVRGNRPPSSWRGISGRSIPACAGEPCLPRERSTSPGVYPRVCGGTLSVQNRGAPSRGLSPRVRGNRAHAKLRVAQAGSIPACAGEPSPCFSAPWPMTVYPRVCGGTHRR